MERVHLIAAARPNFMKVAPLWRALDAADDFAPVIVHTGQHYDANMSDDFFRDLGMPKPKHHLGVGSGSHAEQTGGVMVAYEAVALADRPEWLVVVGDVNSTAACAMVGAKLGLRTVHLEAGLRSRPNLHRRWDADYNGWWMCLIPRVVLEDIWLSLPVFIKWDDAEYGVRANVICPGFVRTPLPEALRERGGLLGHGCRSRLDDGLDDGLGDGFGDGFGGLLRRLVLALLGRCDIDRSGGDRAARFAARRRSRRR